MKSSRPTHESKRSFIGPLLLAGLAAEPLTADGALIAHWKLDEVSGTTAVDSAGANNNGTLINSTNWVTGT